LFGKSQEAKPLKTVKGPAGEKPGRKRSSKSFPRKSPEKQGYNACRVIKERAMEKRSFSRLTHCVEGFQLKKKRIRAVKGSCPSSRCLF